MMRQPPQQLLMGFEAALQTYTQEQKASYYDQVLEFSKSTYEDNLLKLACLDLESPASVNLYAVSFESKDVIEQIITEHNEGVDELHKIQYTDYIGLMMSSITTIINAITYVLIAFVAVSLIVSSIMIGVITLISVQERTKEIGILRAVGASKKDVSRVFNAETLIVGLCAGLVGIGVSLLLTIPINAILLHFTGLTGLKATLPWEGAVILIAISALLTILAGLIPSRVAARKDPVEALRTE
jgi:putative ABC transport system permease protein